MVVYSSTKAYKLICLIKKKRKKERALGSPVNIICTSAVVAYELRRVGLEIGVVHVQRPSAVENTARIKILYKFQQHYRN